MQYCVDFKVFLPFNGGDKFHFKEVISRCWVDTKSLLPTGTGLKSSGAES